jgi:hypothetical protein
MGDDCFLFRAGTPFFADVSPIGSSGVSWTDMVSMGEGSGVCVAWDEVLRGSRRAEAEVSHALRVQGSCSSCLPGASFDFQRTLLFAVVAGLVEEYAIRRECGKCVVRRRWTVRDSHCWARGHYTFTSHFPGLAE